MSESGSRESSGASGRPDEVISTPMEGGGREWLYPEVSRGRYWWARLVLGWALIALFTALPVVEFGGEPAVLLDVVHGRFVVFGAVFHATDTVYLMLLLFSAFLGIALLTALLGRVWCGWGCPQTVYLEFVYRPIERLLEGSANQRKRRDEGDWSFETFWRKVVKQALYLIVSLALAHTFLAYFVSWDRLLVWMTGPPTEHWGVFVAMACTTGLILFDFGYFREQMCTKVCPYARLQSVLMDRDSMIVSYDPNRGEPRGRRTREQRERERAGVELELGDCIDCGACVRTCPTGIDIREGLQMECVSCTQCIDACDDIMEKIGKPKGLIRYTSETSLEGEETALARPRLLVYAALFALSVGTLGFMLSSAEPVEMDVRPAKGGTHRELGGAEDRVANRVDFKIRNNRAGTRTFSIHPVEPGAVEMKWIGESNLELEGGGLGRSSAWVTIPSSALESGGAEIVFEARSGGEVRSTASMSFRGPTQRGEEE